MKTILIKIDENLWNIIQSIGKDNERSVSAEIRFQLTKIYDVPKKETKSTELVESAFN